MIAWRPRDCALVVLLFLTGCKTGNFPRIINESVPVPTEQRARYGVTGLVPPEAADSFFFRYPERPGQAMASVQSETFQTLDRFTSQDRRERDDSFHEAFTHEHDRDSVAEELTEDLFALGFNALLSGAAGLVGGILHGVPKEQIEQGEKAIRAALLERPLAPQVCQTLAEDSASKLIMVPAKEFDYLSSSTNLAPLGRLGLQSVLMVRLDRQRFQANGDGVNPPMIYAVEAKAIISSVQDGRPLHVGTFDYRGSEHRFTKWAADDAKLFRQESSVAARVIGEAIIDHFFR